MEDARLYHLALLQVPGVGHATHKTLISYCGSPQAVFSTPVGKLMRIPGIGEKIARAIHQTSPQAAGQAELNKVNQLGVQLYTHTDAAYPTRLKHIYDAPAILYCKGTLPADGRTVAIVGTRKATDYGRQVTQRIVQELAPYSPTIVSGLAYGIDIEAHRAAVQVGLPTVAVMASGIDIIYPPTHRQTAERMVEAGGALITEYPIGSKPDAPHFPARNRIVAGLAEAVIVVEAASKGGALITAHLAQDYNREIFAVPGNLNQPQSEGCLQLIQKQIAQIFTSVADLASALNWTGESAPAKPPLDLSQFSEPAQAILRLLQATTPGLLLDELAWKSKIPVHQVASLLLELEFQGTIKSLPGKRYRLL